MDVDRRLQWINIHVCNVALSQREKEEAQTPPVPPSPLNKCLIQFIQHYQQQQSFMKPYSVACEKWLRCLFRSLRGKTIPPNPRSCSLLPLDPTGPVRAAALLKGENGLGCSTVSSASGTTGAAAPCVCVCVLFRKWSCQLEALLSPSVSLTSARYTL